MLNPRQNTLDKCLIHAKVDTKYIHIFANPMDNKQRCLGIAARSCSCQVGAAVEAVVEAETEVAVIRCLWLLVSIVCELAGDQIT